MLKPGQGDPCARFGAVALMAESRGGGMREGVLVGVGDVLHLLEQPT